MYKIHLQAGSALKEAAQKRKKLAAAKRRLQTLASPPEAQATSEITSTVIDKNKEIDAKAKNGNEGNMESTEKVEGGMKRMFEGAPEVAETSVEPAQKKRRIEDKTYIIKNEASETKLEHEKAGESEVKTSKAATKTGESAAKKPRRLYDFVLFY